MAQRTCDAPDCDSPHLARGLCRLHWKREHGKRTTYRITCRTCDDQYLSSRPDGKFCSDNCKGIWYSDTTRTKCMLPAHHPVMVRIAIARMPKPKLVKPDLRSARECPGCACWFTPLHLSGAGRMLFCTYRCKRRVTARRRRARVAGSPGSSWRWSDFMRIAARFDYRCAYCGCKPDGQLDPDHVVPLSRGGYDSPTNLLPACRLCNGDKRDLLLGEWELDRMRRGKPAVRTAWAPDDKRFWHLT